jgi:predicted DNA-binding transcriptional regulator YafY
VSEREVEPYGLGWHDRHWYLVGRDRGRQGVRQFRVDRIRGRVRTAADGDFAVPADFDIAEHVGRPAFRLSKEGQGERVVVELHPEIAFMARDALRDNWEFHDLPNGGGLLVFDIEDRRAVLRYVARHAERARIVAPPSLAAEARALFAGVLATHEGEPTRLKRPRRPRETGR